jgi:hypothetical protein
MSARVAADPWKKPERSAPEPKPIEASELLKYASG